MPRPPILKRLLEGILSIGASPSESESQRGGRRVFMLAFILATLLSIPAAIERFDAGYTWVGVVDLVTLAIPVLLLVVIATHPTSYVPALHVMFLVILAGPVLDTAMFGGPGRRARCRAGWSRKVTRGTSGSPAGKRSKTAIKPSALTRRIYRIRFAPFSVRRAAA